MSTKEIIKYKKKTIQSNGPVKICNNTLVGDIALQDNQPFTVIGSMHLTVAQQ